MTKKPLPQWMQDMCDQDAINRALGVTKPVHYANRAMATRPGRAAAAPGEEPPAPVTGPATDPATDPATGEEPQPEAAGMSEEAAQAPVPQSDTSAQSRGRRR